MKKMTLMKLLTKAIPNFSVKKNLHAFPWNKLENVVGGNKMGKL